MSASVVASQTAPGRRPAVSRSSSVIPAARAAPTLRAPMRTTRAPQPRATAAVRSVQESATTSTCTGMLTGGGPAQRGQAGGQQRFLVVRGHHDAALITRARSHQARRLGDRYRLAIGAEVDLGQEVGLAVADQPGQPAARGERRCTSSPDLG